MNFSEGLEKALNTKWSFVNAFTVFFGFNSDMADIAKQNGVDINGDMNLSIISIDTPQFQNKEIEAFIGNKWFIHNGRDELYRFSITFRDSDQMRLYNVFNKFYHYSREQYFENAKFSIAIHKDADWAGEDDKTVMVLEDCMISGISQVQFNNATENQIAEFSVNFKCLTPNVF